MTTTRVRTLPVTWDDARDLPFFRITERLFTPDFCFGAGVLLASYDNDRPGAVDGAATTERRTSTATAARLDTHTQPERGRLPVQVRRTG